MTETTRWSFPTELQPTADAVAFDLRASLDAIVALRSEVPEDAFTAPILGTERVGSGVVIREDGLVLTIGYLITEAEQVWLTTNAGNLVPGHPLAYDQATGLGLVMPLGRLGIAPMSRGSAASLAVGDEAFIFGRGGRAHALKARIIARREFAGYWEYVLDEALFTAPAHPEWSGAALVDPEGMLVGIGSLLVQEQVAEESVQGNMFVPVDLLEPILDDLLKFSRPARPPRAWLGMYTTEIAEHLVVNGLAKNGPADRAGVKLGDVIVDVAGQKPVGLADFFRRVWKLGPAGVTVPLTLARDGGVARVEVRSGDRNDFLRKPLLQ